MVLLVHTLTLPIIRIWYTVNDLSLSAQLGRVLLPNRPVVSARFESVQRSLFPPDLGQITSVSGDGRVRLCRSRYTLVIFSEATRLLVKPRDHDSLEEHTMHCRAAAPRAEHLLLNILCLTWRDYILSETHLFITKRLNTFSPIRRAVPSMPSATGRNYGTTQLPRLPHHQITTFG